MATVQSACNDDPMSLTTYRIDREGSDRLLFLFHGYSAEQHHLAAYVPLIDPDERFTAICPRAINDLREGDGASWFTIGEDGFEPASFVEAVDVLRAFVAEEAGAAGVPLERCVLGGFSQGGYLALALAGHRDAPAYGGVWAMCCGLGDIDGLETDFTPGARRPALIQYGTRDPFIPAEATKDAADALSAAGWQVQLEAYDMDHSQRLEMMIDAREFLANIS